VDVVGICNLALSCFCNAQISSLTEPSREAKMCRFQYEPAKKALLREFPWNFATNVTTLVLTSMSVPAWDYVYTYPANCLRLLRVFNLGDDINTPKEPYRVISDGVNSYICSQQPNACVEYIIDIQDPNQFDAAFVEAFALKLALKIVTPLAVNLQRKQDISIDFKNAMAAAWTANAGENWNPPQWSTNYADSRR